MKLSTIISEHLRNEEMKYSDIFEVESIRFNSEEKGIFQKIELR